DLNQAGRKAVRRLVYGRRRFFAPAPRRLPAGMRYAVLGVLLGVAFVAQFPVFQVLSPINLLAKSVVFGVGLGLAIVAVIVVVEWFVPRLWCRALCPLGALYSLVGRRALLRVRFDPVLADHQPCRLCAANCPMGIPVMDYRAPEGPNRVDDPSCIRCGTCVDTCPRGMLGLGFRPLRASPGRPSLVPTCRHDG
ncbi:MAG: 4Fe-4S binding protein, partial [Planctomycetota bacterium]